jgi:DNA primase
MAGRFPSAWVDEVYSRANIVDIVSSYLPLKQQGRNFIGLCPFHNEKTPSFSVNQENNVYHCFGCKAGGNVVQFVMEMERLSYPDALLHIAKQLNMSPPPEEYNPRAEQERNRRERMYQLNRDAALYYHEVLYSPEGAAVLDYLHRRGITDGLIRRFGLGASPNAWSSAMDTLVEKGYTKEELQTAGLIHVKENHAYDVFRDRAIFPIIDLYGNTLGFGGRALGNAQPKYLNTQDTLVFNKRYGVYGANLLRRQRGLERIILVEGYMDVLALAQADIQGVVATLGTVLTAEQARLLKRFAPEVWIAYDGDEAGQMATLRALDIFAQEMIPARVLRFPEGLDPDDLLKQKGRSAFDALRPMREMAFRLERLKPAYDWQSQEGLSAYAIKACDMISSLPDPVERDIYLKRLANETGLSYDVLAEQLQHALDSRIGRAKAAPPPVRKGSRSGRQPAKDSQAEKTLISLLATGFLPEDMILPEDFESPSLRVLAEGLLQGRRPAQLMADCENEADRSQASEVFSAAVKFERVNAVEVAEDCLRTLRAKRLSRKISGLSRDLHQMDDQEKRKALEDIMRLRAEQNSLRGPSTGQ